MNSKRFQKAIETIIGSEETRGSAALEILAGECDDLAAAVESDARDMAQLYSEFADDVARGQSGADPLGYARARTLSENAVKRQCKVDELVRLVRVMYGQDAVVTLRAALVAS